MPVPTPTATDSSTGHRRPGRPRCDELDDRLVEAVLELLHDGADVTVNAVVRASGVSRATLYRR
ncbi:hypothetical protein [Brevibacterium litoralis]|uniref:hypothetical protein n=1 Tax=Brevibacterium litoralis TaxID=3138935 RepID=UPI0032EB08E4